MVTGVRVIQSQVFKKRFDVSVKEPLDFCEIELGVDKYGADV